MSFLGTEAKGMLNQMGIPIGKNLDETQRAVAAILESGGKGGSPLVSFGDQRLNQIAARTFNEKTCIIIYQMLERALLPSENTWSVIRNALLVIRVCTVYGSEHAVDKSIGIAYLVHKLVNYNSATQQKQGLLFTGQGGQDHGAPVREEANVLDRILASDETIRNARGEARNVKDEGNDTGLGTLVPMGDTFSGEAHDGVKKTGSISFGQGMNSSVGAGFDLQAVPGMYEGRPERYFDNKNDTRARVQETGDAQHTRDAMYGSSLLDLPEDTPGGDMAEVNSNLPVADYLPALQRQKELEAQLSAQAQQLAELQRIHAQAPALAQPQPQQPQQPQQQPAHNPLADILSMPVGASTGMGMGMIGGGQQADLLGLGSAPVGGMGAPVGGMGAPVGGMGMMGQPQTGMGMGSMPASGMTQPGAGMMQLGMGMGMGMGSAGMGMQPQGMMGQPQLGMGMGGNPGMGMMGQPQLGMGMGSMPASGTGSAGMSMQVPAQQQPQTDPLASLMGMGMGMGMATGGPAAAAAPVAAPASPPLPSAGKEAGADDEMPDMPPPPPPGPAPLL